MTTALCIALLLACYALAWWASHGLHGPVLVDGRDVSAPARWRRTKRAILDAHPALCASPWLRRWAGGRWAHLALRSPGYTRGMDWAELAVRAGEGSLAAMDAETVPRWRPVEACPHEHWVTINNDPAPVLMAPHCECEVWP